MSSNPGFRILFKKWCCPLFDSLSRYRDEQFYFTAVVLWSISDYPAFGILTGYEACVRCHKEQLPIDRRDEDESQFATPEIVVPHGLPAEESHAPRATL